MDDKEGKPASMAEGPTYDPQAIDMKHDAKFASFAPGVANSGNLAHKWGAEGDHAVVDEPPTGLKGD